MQAFTSMHLFLVLIVPTSVVTDFDSSSCPHLCDAGWHGSDTSFHVLSPLNISITAVRANKRL